MKLERSIASFEKKLNRLDPIVGTGNKTGLSSWKYKSIIPLDDWINLRNTVYAFRYFPGNFDQTLSYISSCKSGDEVAVTQQELEDVRKCDSDYQELMEYAKNPNYGRLKCFHCLLVVYRKMLYTANAFTPTVQINPKSTSSRISFLIPFSNVYSNWKYALSIFITTSFWVLFNTLEQRLFFSPVMGFYVPNSTFVDFVLSSMIAVLLGVCTSINLYAWRSSCRILTKSSSISLFSSSSISIFTSVCAACAPSIATFLTIILGSSTAIAIYSLTSQYHIFMLSISLLLLLWGTWNVANKLSKVNRIEGYKQNN